LPASVSIGGFQVPLRRPLHPELVGFPNVRMLPGGPESAETAGALRWLAQKQALRQDAMLIGDCIPTLRALALSFCQLTGREVEVVSLSRDTTESDLKQRREISQATVKYSDQPVVQARGPCPSFTFSPSLPFFPSLLPLGEGLNATLPSHFPLHCSAFGGRDAAQHERARELVCASSPSL
jgi:hypothetical protein